MESPVTLRLDREIRERIKRIARQKRVSASAVMREAIKTWVEDHEATVRAYDSIADLIGVVHGGTPGRSVKTGRQLKALLMRRRDQS